MRVGVPRVGVAAHEVFGQDHDEALEHDQEQPLLVHVRRFQPLLHTLHGLGVVGRRVLVTFIT